MSLDVYLEDPSAKYDVESLYSANITHNLGKIAKEAGIYIALWRPEEMSAEFAKDIISTIEKGLNDLRARPKHFAKFNSSNGWGMYEHFVPFVEDYLNACRHHPKASVKVLILLTKTTKS